MTYADKTKFIVGENKVRCNCIGHTHTHIQMLIVDINAKRAKQKKKNAK